MSDATTETTAAPQDTVVPAIPQIEQIKGRIEELEGLRDDKIKNADLSLKQETDAIKERHKQDMKTEIDAVRGRHKSDKIAARDNCKNAVQSWNKVLKSKEAEEARAVKAAEDAEAAKFSSVPDETDKAVADPQGTPEVVDPEAIVDDVAAAAEEPAEEPAEVAAV